MFVLVLIKFFFYSWKSLSIFSDCCWSNLNDNNDVNDNDNNHVQQWWWWWCNNYFSYVVLNGSWEKKQSKVKKQNQKAIGQHH